MSSLSSTNVSEFSSRIVEQERLRLLALGASIRLSAAAFFLLVGLVDLATNPQLPWSPRIPTMAAYALAAGLFFVFRRKGGMLRLAPVAAAIDLVLPYLILRIVMAEYPESAQLIAGSALGLFTVLVTLHGLTLRRSVIVVVAIVATIEECLLLRQTGIPYSQLLFPAGVLALTVAGGFTIVVRAHRFLNKITELETAREQLVQTRVQYDQLSRLQQDKDSLVQLIVHDMKSPISAAILSLEFLNRELARQRSSRDVMEAIDDAITSSTSVANMIFQILDTTKLEEGRITLNLEAVSVRELLDTARRQTLLRVQNKSIHLDVDAPDSLSIFADRRLFPRLLDNLLSNAIRYTPNEGRILLMAIESGGEIVLSVHNTGLPIPLADREKIFDKFQQGDNETRRMLGWGLGLYFCRLVVEAHHGRIAVEDVEGWPTSFVIRLPLPPNQPAAG